MLNNTSLRSEYRQKRRLLGIVETDPEPKGRPVWQMVVFFLGVIAIVFIGSCQPAHAYTDSDAIKAIIGEAENQGYEGMLAVACAIRNRGTLKGVYGLKAKRVKYSLFNEETFVDASNAWKESEKRDITHGATHWENIKAFGCPSWVKGCIEVFRYRDHVFYKEAA